MASEYGVVCAWCGAWIKRGQPADEEDGLVSHGMCATCALDVEIEEVSE